MELEKLQTSCASQPPFYLLFALSHLLFFPCLPCLSYLSALKSAIVLPSLHCCIQTPTGEEQYASREICCISNHADTYRIFVLHPNFFALAYPKTLRHYLWKCVRNSGTHFGTCFPERNFTTSTQNARPITSDSSRRKRRAIIGGGRANRHT